VKVTEQPSLQTLNTLRVPARAALLLELETEEDVLALPAVDAARDIVLGGGSNILLVTDVPGTVILNRIRGIDVVSRDQGTVLVEIGAGENWHGVVCHALDHGWHGLENLSLIPGLAGAAPIQNIGAYGVELSSVLETVTAWDWQRAAWVVLSPEDCRLGYRDSLFKSVAPDRYLITSIRLRLALEFKPQLDYAGLTECLQSAGVTGIPDAREVSEAVIRLRRQKLPDPAVTANAGSFFKNPVVSLDRLACLRERDPALPAWKLPENEAKIPAAWLIERCGLKGLREGGAGVSDRHALVLVNHGSATGAELYSLAERVMNRVEERFGIRLEPEPRIYRGPGTQHPSHLHDQVQADSFEPGDIR
jgi:UDP-N-acetylmuramate dehydrogenase